MKKLAIVAAVLVLGISALTIAISEQSNRRADAVIAEVDRLTEENTNESIEYVHIDSVGISDPTVRYQPTIEKEIEPSYTPTAEDVAKAREYAHAGDSGQADNDDTWNSDVVPDNDRTLGEEVEEDAYESEYTDVPVSSTNDYSDMLDNSRSELSINDFIKVNNMNEEVIDDLYWSDSNINMADDTAERLYQVDDSQDVYQIALERYGIDYLTTERMLKLITVEGYAEDYLLDYYVACACVTRARFPENFDGSNIYEKFGEMDGWYGTWIDEAYGIADHAYGALRDALLDPTYINQVNGMASPNVYIYYSERYGIYVWNP